MLIMRQWREVKRMKRFKRGHAEGGVRATAQGELVLRCRACPQPGWNLPDNWEEIDPLYRFIYWLFLAMDANFRLSNRNVSTEIADPILGDGFGYFCRREGEDGYKAHILKHADEEEISNCSGFAAMFMANTKRVKGLRTTGIGGVTCSRHNMWQGNGIGDLQVGERYGNMDFLLLSMLFVLQLMCIVVSYDIACQYNVTFWERMKRVPKRLWLKLKPSMVLWKVPNFHLPAHKPNCHSPFSFHFMWGAGMTHGEASTRLMGPSARQATLEDVFGFHNYNRVLAMHRVLPKRLAVSIKEGMKHKVAFEAFTEGLEEAWPEDVAEWKAHVLRWEATPHPKTSESPFELVDEVSTLRDIQLRIAVEDFVCTKDGVEIERDHTPGSFITMGLELEQVQQKLEIDLRALKDPSPAQKLAFTKRRTSLFKRIHKFRQIQGVYMPALRLLLSDDQKQVYDGNSEQQPEATRLFMPSELASNDLRATTGLAAIEARMREGEADEALEAIHTTKLRYQYARAALLALRGHGPWEERLQILDDEDVRALNERALTEEEKKQNEHWAELGGAIIEGGVARAAGLAGGEGSHTLSWICCMTLLRLEWCKAYARAKRYSEDVRLLREEMRRTVAFGYTSAALWDELAEGELPDSDPELTEGRRAYAAEHADTERKTCRRLEEKWAGILAKADQYLEGTVGLDAESVVTIELDEGDELDQEEEEARLEGEEDEE
ncbi:hypothetical protein B0H14DRAFT_3638925 [Mycena olivaceomarginata]|nr:hypothetical protein B0H14DRAFT_3638925 [Mycena olivaceomarginata]